MLLKCYCIFTCNSGKKVEKEPEHGRIKLFSFSHHSTVIVSHSLTLETGNILGARSKIRGTTSEMEAGDQNKPVGGATRRTVNAACFVSASIRVSAEMASPLRALLWDIRKQLHLLSEEQLHRVALSLEDERDIEVPAVTGTNKLELVELIEDYMRSDQLRCLED